jgi:hypothetical protein
LAIAAQGNNNIRVFGIDRRITLVQFTESCLCIGAISGYKSDTRHVK